MTPYYADESVTLYHGDALAVLASLPDTSVDAVVTDPPYELGFMGRAWDASGVAYSVDLWRDCLRVLKPGGHLLAFGGTRTYHRLTCAIEDAGFEIRDEIAWLYGSGFPKSLDVSKAIDKAAGAEREVVGRYVPPNGKAWNLKNDSAEPGYKPDLYRRSEHMDVSAPATDDAKRWQGWGTALKPSHEPIVVARKPLAGTVAANVLAHGTGALNIDGCRIGEPEDKKHPSTKNYQRFDPGSPNKETQVVPPYASGRWPTNVVLDEYAAAELDAQSGDIPASLRTARRDYATPRGTYSDGLDMAAGHVFGYGDSGGASRFFPVFRYEAKADTAERPRVDGEAHPTVKPLDLMRWLVRLVTPPGGLVLDPFAGSGTTAEACVVEGFRCLTVEREERYLPLIVARLSKPIQPTLAPA